MKNHRGLVDRKVNDVIPPSMQMEPIEAMANLALILPSVQSYLEEERRNLVAIFLGRLNGVGWMGKYQTNSACTIILTSNIYKESGPSFSPQPSPLLCIIFHTVSV